MQSILNIQGEHILSFRSGRTGPICKRRPLLDQHEHHERHLIDAAAAQPLAKSLKPVKRSQKILGHRPLGPEQLVGFSKQDHNDQIPMQQVVAVRVPRGSSASPPLGHQCYAAEVRNGNHIVQCPTGQATLLDRHTNARYAYVGMISSGFLMACVVQRAEFSSPNKHIYTAQRHRLASAWAVHFEHKGNAIAAFPTPIRSSQNLPIPRHSQCSKLIQCTRR